MYIEQYAGHPPVRPVFAVGISHCVPSMQTERLRELTEFHKLASAGVNGPNLVTCQTSYSTGFQEYDSLFPCDCFDF
jgi:hypothetical protein